MAAIKNPINTALKRVVRNLTEARRNFQRAMQQIDRGNQLAARTLARLKTVPGAPRYPIRFTTPLQQRAFFASKGFGRGIPASRSNPPAVLEAWEAAFVPTSDGGIIGLYNDAPHMEFVQGARAQGFHIDTGYVQLDDVEQEAFAEMQDVAIAQWFSAADPLEGV